MRLRQAAQTMVPVEIGETTYQLPRFGLRDWVQWQHEVDAREEDRRTAKCTPEQRAQLSAFYRLLPHDLNTMRQHLFTPEGVDRVVGTCMRRAGIPEEQINALLSGGVHAGDLERLAEELGDMESEDRKAARELIATLQKDLSGEREKSAALEAKLKAAGGGGAAADPLPNLPPPTPSSGSTT